jgi:hypothetical protein
VSIDLAAAVISVMLSLSFGFGRLD